MLKLFLAIFLSLLSLPFAASSPIQPENFPQGTISLPANGTNVMPGQSFPFQYNIRSDYCTSSYNFTVWLLTSPPSSVFSGAITGHFFGRFSEESYPANPFPSNPVPSELVMPDFSKPEGGFGAGATASSIQVYLAVIEEWDTCDPTLGTNLSLAANSLIYNNTVSS